MCIVERKGFPRIIRDNDETFFQHIIACIDSVDELSYLTITKCSFSYKFRIAPSTPEYISSLIETILQFCNLYGMRIDMSKSIKSAATLTFNISHNNE